MSNLFQRSLLIVRQCRDLHLSSIRTGTDQRSKYAAHLPKTDIADGERMNINRLARSAYLDLIKEDLYRTVHNGIKFTDLHILHIKCTRNNTKIALTTGDGRILGLGSPGLEGYKNCRKGTTVGAQAAARRILSLAEDLNVKNVRLVLKGLGPGRNAAVKCIEISGLNVISISDRTDADEPATCRPRAAKSI